MSGENTSIYSKIASIQKAKKPEVKQEVVSQSAGGSTSQPTVKGSGKYAGLKTVPRPKAFYISTQLDEWLDDAVRYFKKQGIGRADRSTLVNMLLHDKELWSSKSLSKKKDQVLEVLTAQLVN